MAPDFKEVLPPGLRKPTQGHKRLSVPEKLAILHKVLVLFELQKDVAKEFRLRVQVVSSLVCKVKNNPKLLNELVAHQEDLEQHE